MDRWQWSLAVPNRTFHLDVAVDHPPATITSYRVTILKDFSSKDCFPPYTIKNIDLSKTGDKKILMRWISSTRKEPPYVFSCLRRYREGDKRHFEEWLFNNMEFVNCFISRGKIEQLTFHYCGLEWRTNPYRDSD